MRVLIILFLLTFTPAFSQRVEIFADLEKNEIDTDLDFLASFNENIFFYEQVNGKNKYIFKSDGTQDGTNILKDISNFSYSTCTGIYAGTNKLIFGTLEYLDYKLYISDGTSNGTQLIHTTTIGKYSNFLEVNGTIYFTIGNNVNSTSLWKTDGTNEGTVLIKGNIGAKNLYKFNNLLYFVGYTATTGNELWRSDGTLTGTDIIVDRVLGSGDGILVNTKFITHENFLYYISAGSYLIKSDGTNQLNLEFLNFNLSTYYSLKPTDIVINNTDLYVITEGYLYSSLYKYNFVNSTLTNLSQNSSYGYLTGLTVFNGNVYCHNLNFFVKSNGTINGTREIFSLFNGSEYIFPKRGQVLNNNLYFHRYKIIGGKYYYSIWKTDGTTQGTVLVKEYGNGIKQYNASTFQFLEHRNQLFFFINDGLNGREIHKTDGTPNGTNIVKNIGIPNINNGTNQTNLAEFDGKFLIYGDFPYSLDTVSKTTTLISNQKYTIQPFKYKDKVYLNSRQRVNLDLTNLENYCSDCSNTPIFFQNKLFVSTNSGGYGDELYSYDGTTFNLIKDINTLGSSTPKPLGVIGNKLIFTAYHPNSGFELWSSNGTDVGTNIIKDIIPGTSGIDIRKGIVLNDLLIFEFYNVNRYELWRSDGTELGTFCISTNLPAGTFDHLYVFNNRCYFIFYYYSNGSNWKLYQTDGTLTETKPLLGDYSWQNAYPYYTTANNTLYLLGIHPIYRNVIYKIVGDSVVVISNPTNPSSSHIKANSIIAFDDRRFIYTTNDIYGYSDVINLIDLKNNKTSFLKEIQVGASFSSSVNLLKKVNNLIFFNTDDGVYGNEFWVIRFPKCENELNIIDNYHDSIIKLNANYKIEATNNITGGNLIYRSGEVILLNPGFKIDSGSIFKAEIGACENY